MDFREDSAPHILVVEDETALAELIRYNLAAEGYRMAIAADGEEAEVLLAEDSFDLVVLDWTPSRATARARIPRST